MFRYFVISNDISLLKLVKNFFALPWVKNDRLILFNKLQAHYAIAYFLVRKMPNKNNIISAKKQINLFYSTFYNFL